MLYIDNHWVSAAVVLQVTKPGDIVIGMDAVMKWWGTSQSLILMSFKQETGITDNDREPSESIQPRSSVGAAAV